MYKTTSILALGLFLTLAPQAFAQTQSDDQLQMQQDTGEATTQDRSTQSTDTETGGETVIEQLATDKPVERETEQQTADEPADMDTEQQTADEPADMDTGQQTAEQEAPDASEEAITGQIAEQKEGMFLSSSLVGAEVLSQDGESIGNINDLILAEDGRLQGVVVGVGGFLGLGEKHVAIGMDSIEMRPSMDNPDQVEIVSDQTREQLEEGTAFKTLADVRAEEEAARAEQEAQQTQAPEPQPLD